ncbi:MAG: molybdenum cofactor biosynthesis protein MoaE [Gammaproteobacteria bacterium]|nr:MAG: molybdenum cofactor biosynthesis protein MoaE [Gammaproteobacteria bacterium]
MTARILETPFEPWLELDRYQKEVIGRTGRCGGAATFVGTMRDINEGDGVQAMFLEHYPGMTEKHLEDICAYACSNWDIIDALIIHRVGELHPDDPIVLVAAWAGHRGPALEACRYLIEELKSRAPFWKKETLGDGDRWVEHNTPG